MKNKIFIIEPSQEYSSISSELKSKLKAKGLEFSTDLANADYVVYLACKENINGTGKNSVHELIKLEKKVIIVKLDDSFVLLSIFRMQRIILFKNGKINQKVWKNLPQEIYDVVTEKRKPNELSPGQKLIFISYGHDQYGDNLVDRIQQDLNKTEKFRPWIDTVYLYSTKDWELEIMKGITNSSNVVLFMTDFSMRRPDGYCLNEISYSFESKKQIIPIRIEDTFTPLSIINVPKMSFSNCVDKSGKVIDEEKYQTNFKNLLLVLEGKLELSAFDADNIILRRRLKFNDDYKIIDNSQYIRWNPSFVQREWLDDKYEEWLKDQDSKVLFLVGNAGSGKSAFISYLCDKKPNIRAVHFCKFGDSSTAEPRNIIISLAFQLACQIPQYREKLLEMSETDGKNWIENKDIENLFDYLIGGPLSTLKLKKTQFNNNITGESITVDNQIIVIVIDAIDEAMQNSTQQRQLLSTIVKKFKKGYTPDWLKLIITSRPQAIVNSNLSTFKQIEIDNNKKNQNDILKYLKASLNKYIKNFDSNKQNTILQEIVKKSENNFLYASEVKRGIEEKTFDIEKPGTFPNGLNGWYNDWFSNRLFGQDAKYDYKSVFRPLFEIVLSSLEPINNDKLIEILNLDSYDFEEQCEYIKVYFPTINGCMQPYHKSLADWLTDKEKSTTAYWIDLKHGHKRLADYLYKKYQKNNFDDYLIKHLAEHSLKANSFDKTKEILCNDHIQEERIKLLGKDIALEQYFNEIYELSEHDKIKAIDVMKSPQFLSIFAKYRKYLFTTNLYIVLKKAGFDQIWKTIDRYAKENIAIVASIINYLIANNEYDDAIKIFPFKSRDIDNYLQKYDQTDSNHLTVVLELINKLGILNWKKQFISTARDYFSIIVHRFSEIDLMCDDDSPIRPDYEELSLAYEYLGDILYHVQVEEKIINGRITKIDEALEAYKYAIYYLKKYQKSIKDSDMSLKKDIDIREKAIKVQICLHKIISWKLEDLEYVKNELPNLIQTFKDTKIKDSRYVKVMYLDFLYHIYEHNYDYVYRHYKNLIDLANNNGNEYDIGFVEFTYALACYLDNKIDEAKKHIDVAMKAVTTLNAIVYNEFWILKMLINNTDDDKKTINEIKEKEFYGFLRTGREKLRFVIDRGGGDFLLLSWYKKFTYWIESLKDHNKK